MSEERKLLEPVYGPALTCLADACPENCCMEWIIDLDDATAAYYRTLSGPFGDRIRSWMRSESSFEGEDGRNVLDESGLFTGTSCTSFALDGKLCPFQKENGLCEIRLNLGYEHTSETCREHPMNTEEYEGFAERSPSVSCPEVTRLVFETPVAGAYPKAPEEAEDPVLNELAAVRNRILSPGLMAGSEDAAAWRTISGEGGFDEDLPLDRHIEDLFERVFDLQPALNEAAPSYAYPFEEEAFEEISEILREFSAVDESPLVSNLLELIAFMRDGLSILTDRWRRQLDIALSENGENSGDAGARLLPWPANILESGKGEKEVSGNLPYTSFGEYLDDHRTPLSRLFAYYVYRYFLKAVNDCAAPVWAAFIAAGAIVPAYLSYCSGTPLAQTTAWYSREIEHDGDNAEKLLDYFSESIDLLTI